MNRQSLIEAIYDSTEFPHSEKAVYSDIYYAFINAMNMTEDDQKYFFKWLYCPSRDYYRLTPEYCVETTTKLLDTIRLDLLQSMLDYMNHLNEVAASIGDHY
jgi:hypothetical protein